MDDFSIPGQRRDNLVPERMQGFATKQHTLLKWMQSPDAKAQESAAQKRAWATFTKQYPNANKNQFVAQTHIDKKRNVTAEMFFKGRGIPEFFGHNKGTRLLATRSLSPMKNKLVMPIPAVDFTASLKKYSTKTSTCT